MRTGCTARPTGSRSVLAALKHRRSHGARLAVDPFTDVRGVPAVRRERGAPRLVVCCAPREARRGVEVPHETDVVWQARGQQRRPSRAAKRRVGDVVHEARAALDEQRTEVRHEGRVVVLVAVLVVGEDEEEAGLGCRHAIHAATTL